MRTPALVAQAIIDVVPDEEKALITALHELTLCSMYKAPEQFQSCWVLLSNIVSLAIDCAASDLHKAPEWKRKVVEILEDAPIQQVILRRTVKVYAMNDCDWWASASSPEKVRKEYESFTSTTDENNKEPILVSEEDMLRLKFLWEEEAGIHIHMSFSEALNRMISRGDKFPCLFASTEF